ncbi:MAG: TIGR02677 family protein [Lactimicrobium sp.]|jgi:uncharacterized protein (TIGR02677 family)|uniref:TIGR02677 family protein n=1 Tax=Lactimicrobium sp. TaxID=2563780 RepID=UPI002F35DF6F
MEELHRISETAYLTADNAERYRAIMRVFYHAYERVDNRLTTQDVMKLLKEEFPVYQDLSIDQLKLDLNQLTEWKSLDAVQEPRNVYTIAEYRNKQFTYSISKAGIEVERMTVRLETLSLNSASLSTNFFKRIEESLSRMNTMVSAPLKEVNAWWNDLLIDFEAMSNNSNDYLHEFYSAKSEKILKSVAFLVHKDRLISYLREFVVELQSHASAIARLLQNIDETVCHQVLELTVQSELDIPRPMEEINDHLEQDLRTDIYQKWDSLEHWFLNKDGRQAEAMHILDITNDIIQKIIQNAALIVQLQNWGINRRDEYARWIGMFYDCQDIRQAHQLSAVLFGAMQVRHFSVEQERSTDSLSSATQDEEPFVYTLSSHSRTYKPRMERAAYSTSELQKAARRQAYLDEMEKKRLEVSKYIHQGRLSFAKIQDVISPQLRMMLLSWIAQANMTSSKVGRTEYGSRYVLDREEGECVLHCSDGDLTMPCYVIEFEDEG